jgi:hypothetical protein
MVLLLVAVVLRVAPPVMSTAIASSRLPQWDMAKYGVSGLRLARAIQDVEPITFLRHVNGLDVWPPVFPLAEIPAFLIAGPDYASARGLVGLLFLAAIVAAFWSGLHTHHTVGALAAALVASSPMTQVFATLVMLEIPSTLLLLLAVGSYQRSLKTERSRVFNLACVAAVLLFFCKYNFGLIWILAMTASEALRGLRSAGLEPAAALQSLASNLRRPWPAFLVAGLLVAAVIEIAGPWQFSVGEGTVSVSSSGRLLYALYALSILRWMLRPRRSFRTAKRWLETLGSRTRSMVLLIGAPIALWMVVPSHVVNFVGFLVNRSSGQPLLSLESLSFYPAIFIERFSPAPAIGIVVLVAAAWSLRRLRGEDEFGRVLALALLIASASVIVHPYKQPRFLFIAAPLIWLAASRESIACVARISHRTGRPIHRWAMAAPSIAALLATSLHPVDVERLRRDHHHHSVPASTAEVLEDITDLAAGVRVSVLLGTWNHLSPWLVEWSCLQRREEIDPSQVPRSPTSRKRGGITIGWIEAAEPDVVMVLSTSPNEDPPAGFEAETEWLEPVRRRLASDSRYQLASSKDFEASHYLLESFEPTRHEGQPVPR